ncbi:Uma2 family endonuclease [Alkalinema sp. FACHB-956]|uniref:Uma2 family endonuclease n=1 Tax=Alkalinema sp. FACHB-956 TaxID=2692768 RepID=UPI001684248D|nr:Uma2 family endonuclease [Alkalinema sp. FACHB-956]MBD2329667.1 Uma2 family endonuclease [Alkalinema sp. FACHB-956]
MTIAVQKLTLKEYLAYEDGTGHRYELVDGELVQMPLGTGKHSDISDFLTDEFRDEINRTELDWIAKAMKIGLQSPRGSRWETSRIPDVVVLPLEQWESMADREGFIPLNEPQPILVVEVVSPSTVAIDYRAKHSEYAVLDIPEYWIADPIEQKVTVCTLKDGAYSDQVFTGTQVITSQTFPGLNLTAEQVLRAKR